MEKSTGQNTEDNTTYVIQPSLRTYDVLDTELEVEYWNHENKI